MPKYPRFTRHALIAGLLLLLVISISGCDRLIQALTPEPSPPQAVPSAGATEAVVPSVAPVQPTPTSTPDVFVLTVWTTEDLGPVGQGPGPRELSAQIAAFEAANPGVKVEAKVKRPYGKGGMLDFLTTTAAAVPAALPAVAILDIRELGSAAQRELIQPLDGLVTPELVQDLVPPARTAGKVNNTWYGLPFQADIQHLIYNTAFAGTAPATWTDVLSSTTPYLFPAGGQATAAGEGRLVNDAFIIQYFGTGARLTGEGGQPALNRESVTAVLQFYADGLEAGVVPDSAIQFTSADATWPTYLSEEVGLANTSAHRYLEARGSFRKSSYAPIPTRDGIPTSVFRGWAYVLVAQQPERQQIAWSLIEWLTAADHLGRWALAANYLPTRLSAWPPDDEDEYLNFLAELLPASQVRPTGAGHDELGRGLQRAVQAIFAGTATPAEAAAQAEASVP